MTITFIWGCASIAQLGEEAIERTNTAWWKKISSRDDPHYCQCFFLRGLVPSHRTRRRPAWQAQEHEQYDQDAHLTMHSYAYGSAVATDFPIYLDGSGGPYTKDKRVRLCTWAWVQILGEEHDFQLRCGVSGACTSLYQTVPRAEIQTLHEFLVILVCSEVQNKHYDVYSDNDGVVQGWVGGEEMCRRSEAASMWQRAWTSMVFLRQRGVTVNVLRSRPI